MRLFFINIFIYNEINIIIMFHPKKCMMSIFVIIILTSSSVIAIPLKNDNIKIYSVGSTLYVGGSGLSNYTKIQDAIDNASDDDIVFVYSGIYYENLIVNKSINLKGEDKNSTIIDGMRKNHVVLIITDHVKINGFTIKNCKQDDYQSGIYLKSANYSEIYNNNIIKNFYLEKHNQNHHICGVFIDRDSSNNHIHNNNISNNEEGIVLYNSRPGNNISNNFISCIEYWCVLLLFSNDNKIIGNEIYCNLSNDAFNIGLYLCESSKNIICRNLIIGGFWGDAIWLSEWSDKNTVCYNTIKDFNSTNGYGGGIGIRLTHSNKNEINYNNFVNNLENVNMCSSHFNRLKRNYWDDWIGLKSPYLRILPKVIYGYRNGLIFKPLRINIDWHPAKEPYEIDIDT